MEEAWRYTCTRPGCKAQIASHLSEPSNLDLSYHAATKTGFDKQITGTQEMKVRQSSEPDSIQLIIL